LVCTVLRHPVFRKDLAIVGWYKADWWQTIRLFRAETGSYWTTIGWLSTTDVVVTALLILFCG
jgi:hypothetical protein